MNAKFDVFTSSTHNTQQYTFPTFWRAFGLRNQISKRPARLITMLGARQLECQRVRIASWILQEGGLRTTHLNTPWGDDMPAWEDLRGPSAIAKVRSGSRLKRQRFQDSCSCWLSFPAGLLGNERFPRNRSPRGIVVDGCFRFVDLNGFDRRCVIWFE